MRPRPASLTRRTALGLGLLATASACSLRLEDDAPIPGPTASAAPDATPLRDVRTHLLDAMSAAQHETAHIAEARAAQALHRQHLTRLDATLKGLHATHLASASATAAPTAHASALPSGSMTPRTSAGATRPSGIHPSAPGSSSSGAPMPTAWTRAESIWASSEMGSTLQRVSENSRPLALAIASRGVASLPPGTDLAWTPDLRIAAGTAFLTPLADAIAALEWLAATTPFAQRMSVAERLHQLYTVRSAADAADPSAATSASTPAHRYASSDAARSVVGKAGEAMASACASAAPRTQSPQQATGLVLAWSSAITTQTYAGLHPGAWPGMAV